MRKTWSGVLPLAFGVLLAASIFTILPAEAAQTFNVKKFGATGNGSTNDTSALLAAFAAANASPGSTILFPPGNYLYSSELIANGIAVVGQHATLTAIAPVIDLELTGTRVSIQGMTIATQADAVTGVFVFKANGFSVTNNIFNAGLVLPIQSALSSNGLIQSNKMTVSHNATGIAVSESQTVSIENNVATGVGTNTDFLILSASSNVRVISNRASGMDAIAADAANSVVLYQHNAFSGYTEAGLEMSSDQNVTISGNQFVGGSPASAALLLGSLQNVLVSGNTIQNGLVGVEAGGCRNIQISGNTVSNTQEVGLELGGDNTVVASGNTITRTGIGIETGSDTNMSLTGNQIAQCQQQGIFSGSDTGTETIFNNAIRSCGLAATNPPAVIFVDSPSATSISITHNSYTGNTSNLQFFIRCIQQSPPAQVSGNSTNTGLPTQVGP